MALEDSSGVVGHLVELHGLNGPVPAEYRIPEVRMRRGRASCGVDVNGKVGQCILIDEVGMCLVVLFDGYAVRVGKDHVKEWTPPRPEDGGFDVAWPATPYEDEGLFHLARCVSDTVARKGWCLIRTTTDDEFRQDALWEARNFPDFRSPKAEFLTDLLGRDGQGKISELELEDMDEVAEAWQDTPLSYLDRQLTHLGMALSGVTEKSMGFSAPMRRKGMVWLPFDSSEEAQQLLPTPLNEDDVEMGLVEDHLLFLKQRKLCFMHTVDGAGGELSLYPGANPGFEPVTLPVSPGMLLVYRSDRVSFGYRPAGRSLVVQTWMLTEQAALEMKAVVCDDQAQKSELLGIRSGPGAPMGDLTYIASMSMRTAGEVIEENTLWAMFTSGCDGFEHMRASRFDVDMYCTQNGEVLPGKSYVRHAAYCADELLFSFDNKFFDLPVSEACVMDPHHKMVLEEGYSCLSRAGYTKTSLRGRAIGVYVGTTGPDGTVDHVAVRKTLPEDQRHEVLAQLEHNMANFTVNARLSHCLGLLGPCSCIDTACSASLVAVIVPVTGMRNAAEGQSEDFTCNALPESQALSVGIATQSHPLAFVGLCMGTMLSRTGRCLTFNDTANGYARGEGCLTSLIRTSAGEGVEEKQRIACILGCFANQDGRSASLTAPNGPAQQDAIRASMFEAGLSPKQITICECHGTGTALGDPIEYGALRGCMEPRDVPLYATSAKSNEGHLEAAAGIMGLLKCALMVSSSVACPNVHLSLFNAHLDTHGFPGLMETEMCDTALNSNLAGVSSFGFGGTNARADVWSTCKKGPMQAHPLSNLQMLDQITVTCPITLGPIDYLTGEPVAARTEERRNYHADVLRDEFAPYDISRAVYSGDYRFRLNPEKEVEPELPPDELICICGSWNGWRSEEMEPEGDGWYAATVVLEECRFELFNLCMGRSRKRTIHPAVNMASKLIDIQGPDNQGRKKYWIIDGRDTQVSAGTVFQIHFRWGLKRKEIYWEQVDESLANKAVRVVHNYVVVGSWTSWLGQDLKRKNECTWEGTFKVGSSGREEFQFLRDHDWDQAIYPGKLDTSTAGAPVRGPDHMGRGKHFRVHGDVGAVCRLQLRIDDASVNVALELGGMATKVWRSLEGWDRHHYFVAGSFCSWTPLPMTMESPGLFRSRGVIGSRNSVESFQVWIDEDNSQAFCPEEDSAIPGEVIVRVPDGERHDSYFYVRNAPPGTPFEVILDLTVEDRRKIVTWKVLGPPQAEAALE